MGNTQNKANDNNPNSGSTNNVANYANPVNVNQYQYTGQKSNASIGSILSSRKSNVLSKFSSYTYSITLYMCTPESFNQIFGDGASRPGYVDKTIPGIYIVAQSGGIDNSSQSRALTHNGDTNIGIAGGSNQGLDYYIDDVKFNCEFPGGTSGPTVSTTIEFKISEPIGFNFITDIEKAANAIHNMSDICKQGPQKNAYQQHYILGISFYGYDVNGNLVKATDPLVSEYMNDYSSGNAVIQRFFPMTISNMNFKLGGGSTIYNFEANIPNQMVGFGEMLATVTKPTEIRAATVREAIEGIASQKSNAQVAGILQIMNEEKQDLKDRGLTKFSTTYSVEFEEGCGIDTAVILDDRNVNARTAPMAPVASTQDSNVSESVKTKAINTVRKKISVAPGQNLATVIDNIISKSSYVSDALTEINSSDPETETETKTGLKKLSWYSVNPIVSITGSDPKTNQWTYNITYVIRSFKIPYLRSQYKQISEKFYGATKYYDYWLTGANTEILAYEQTYNNLFYIPIPISTTSDASAGDDKQGSQTPTSPQGGTIRNNTSGKTNRGSDINNAVAAVLYNPGDVVEADIKILGDPDFLTTSISSKTTFNSFYGRDLSIDPLGGQTFIQITFNNATDYNTQGLLDVNDKVIFTAAQANNKTAIKGIIYQVISVASSFSRGSFTQMVHCSLVPDELLEKFGVVNGDQREKTLVADRANKTVETQQRSEVNLSNTKAGMGRGGQGGPTAQELAAASSQSAKDDTKPKYETPYDRMNRMNRESATQREEQRQQERETLMKNLQNGLQGSSQPVNPKTLLPIQNRVGK